MKNINLGVKLLGGFLLTALIILVVGILSIVQQDKLDHETEQLGTEQLPAVENILTVKSQTATIAASMRTLLTPYASKEQLELSHQHLLEARKIYAAARDEFAALPIMGEVKAEWQEFSTSISQWVGVNNQAADISKQLIAMDMTNPDQMKLHMSSFELAHNELLVNTGQLMLLNRDFDGGTDHTACTLGRWIANMDTTNPEIIALVEQIKPVHAELHNTVAEIKELAGRDDHYQAKDLYENKLLPASRQVFDYMRQMSEVADDAAEKFATMSTLLLEKGAAHQAKTFAAIDQMVQIADNAARQTVEGAHGIASTGRMITIICLVVGVVLAIFSGFLLTRGITGPVQKVMHFVEVLAGGDFTSKLEIDQEDEIGKMAKALGKTVDELGAMIKQVVAGVNTLSSSSTELSAVSSQLSSNAENASARSTGVASAAEEMTTNMSSVSAAMEQSASNVGMVATATEEMSSTVGEIARNAAKAKDISEQAVDQSQKTSVKMNELGQAANKIGTVTEAITEISEQTNLLALNATIEAARAGEAGKGFAVVANEIKELAKQTADATIDIKNQIEEMQHTTDGTITDIKNITEVINEINEIITTIATAVEQQSAATSEISENVAQAAAGIAEVNENVAQSSIAIGDITRDIGEISSTSEEVNQGSHNVKESAIELSRLAEQLDGLVRRFKVA
ncbi:methyl-accepting chemotaxis protein [Desulfofustis glycolicus]|uniref:Methyl-accepting chemotaxis protein n=1 Tax=Desulfofustis glycolicus DSM 9705 TaxID=1121409 RepID=A0A1M5RX02_9BACT|nr:methyl-accepting chemotaxis protein [Desulfofustis glycolicus]SHH30754.1 methyl-accepting chemotaxis protein [Desulfofustis glycolicus DSM 9705]